MEEKLMKMPKSSIYRQKSRIGTGTSSSLPVGTGTGTNQSGTGTTASCNLKLAYFCIVKSRIRTQLFRNPKKRLIGV